MGTETKKVTLLLAINSLIKIIKTPYGDGNIIQGRILLLCVLKSLKPRMGTETKIFFA